MIENRRSLRTKFESRVRIEHPELGSAIFRTRDVSDGGIYVLNGQIVLSVGDTVTVQIQDIPISAPIVTMRVVRTDSDGYGLEFVG